MGTLQSPKLFIPHPLPTVGTALASVGLCALSVVSYTRSIVVDDHDDLLVVQLAP